MCAQPQVLNSTWPYLRPAARTTRLRPELKTRVRQLIPCLRRNIQTQHRSSTSWDNILTTSIPSKLVENIGTIYFCFGKPEDSYSKRINAAHLFSSGNTKYAAPRPRQPTQLVSDTLTEEGSLSSHKHGSFRDTFALYSDLFKFKLVDGFEH